MSRIPRSVFALTIAAVAAGASSPAQGACEGVGTVIFFGNGMFNSADDANRSAQELERLVLSAQPATPGKKLVFDVAYKRSEALFEQLFNVAKHKALDDFGRVWLWIQGLEPAPDWFQMAMEDLTIKLTPEYQSQFERLRGHLESYSRYVTDGYNVVLVSHSQGNFFANQVMRGLESHIDDSWSGSIADKSAKNPLYPKFSELFANIQVATPVTETVGGAPWTTFSDDLPMAAVRRVAGALPANVKAKGRGLGPGQDPLGHNFISAYLRVDETRNKILNEIREARSKLRYPIAYRRNAVLIEREKADVPSGASDWIWAYVNDEEEHEAYFRDEAKGPRGIVDQYGIQCIDARPGTYQLRAQAVLSERGRAEIPYQVWSEGAWDRANEKPSALRLTVESTRHRFWDLGTVQVSRGEGLEPMKVTVDIHSTPRLRPAH